MSAVNANRKNLHRVLQHRRTRPLRPPFKRGVKSYKGQCKSSRQFSPLSLEQRVYKEAREWDPDTLNRTLERATRPDPSTFVLSITVEQPSATSNIGPFQDPRSHSDSESDHRNERYLRFRSERPVNTPPQSLVVVPRSSGLYRKYWEDIICSRHPTRPELFAPPARSPLAESPGKRQPVAARPRARSLSPFLRLHPPIPPHLRRPVKIRLEPQGAPRQQRKRRTPPRSPDIPAKRHFGLAFSPVPEKSPSPPPHPSAKSPDGSQHEVTDPVPVAPPPTFRTKRQRRNWERAVAHRKRKETKV
ncbi:unnamed protein product [Trichogramma brassicae]|uniref:Uncharacterized protein n=1 Tax=Trichogramma brassicae TaxID=86971 RepID=A0A6H5J129_9HYME|nr:unnamed protein product [Trichogramma brassicae]